MFAPKEIFPVCLQAGIFQGELIRISPKLPLYSHEFALRGLLKSSQ